jgi:NADPH-dependent 2,4-dienoyl-CoA reductase/sulfur reductase-like enzyme
VKILILGGDAAGMSAAMQIRRRQPDWTVTVLEMGRHTSYAACGIPYFVAGDVARFEDLEVVTPEAFRTKRGVDVRTGWRATKIDVKARTVTAETPDGPQLVEWDRLLIATGAEAVVPPWPGIELEGVLSVRNLEDARRLEALLARGPKTAVVVGAGYVGLEMAEALQRRGLQVTVLEKLDAVMGGLSAEITRRVSETLARHGVGLRLSTTVEGFDGEEGRVRAVQTDSGPVPAELVVVALGARPRSQLAREAGIPLGAGGAIQVDDRQRTPIADVWAAGDVAESWHRVLERPVYVPLALGANRMGRVAGATMSGDDDVFPGIVGSAVTKVFDLGIARTGVDAATARAEGWPVSVATATTPARPHYFPGHDPVWVELVYRSDDERVLGALLCGEDTSIAKRSDILATAITAQMTLSDVADLDLAYAPPFAPVWDPVIQVANTARFAR